jgi:hypothetical protein
MFKVGEKLLHSPSRFSSITDTESGIFYQDAPRKLRTGHYDTMNKFDKDIQTCKATGK